MDLISEKPWLLFWIFVISCHLYLDYFLFRQWKRWSRGMTTGFSLSSLNMRVLRIWLYEVFLQRQLLSLSVMRWLIHQSIFWGFIALAFLSMAKFVLLLLSMISLDGGLYHFFSKGSGYPVIKIWGDFFGLTLLAGCAGALARRFVLRPLQTAHDQTDAFLTAYLLFMTLSGFLLEGLRLAAFPSGLDRYAFIGRIFMPAQAGIVSDPAAWHAGIWILHAFTGVAILAYLPHSKLLHGILAPLVLALNASAEQGRKDMYWPKTKQYRPTK